MNRNVKNAVSLIIIVSGLLFQMACKSDSQEQNTVVDSTQNQLDSSASAGAKAFDESFKKFAFIVDNKYLVLSDSTLDAWSAANPSEHLQTNSAHYAAASVRVEALPELYKTAATMEFAVYSVTGERFIAKVDGFEILSIEIPHFGTIQQWNGEQGDAAMSDSAIASSIWESGKHFLVARLSISGLPTDELCFAVPSQQANVTVYDTIPFDTQDIVASLVQRYDYVANQHEYEEATGSKQNWWDEASSATIVASVKNSRNEVFTILSESAGEMCGGPYYFEATSIWCTKNGTPEFQKMNSDKSFMLVAIIDIDGDDVPEYVVDDGFGGRYLLMINELDRVFKIPYHDCPC